MRQKKLSLIGLLFCLLVVPAFHTSASSLDDSSDEYDETSRVVRISLLSGTVSLKRAGDQQWERAALNLPLVEGDTIATEDNSRVELQIDARNFVRLSARSVLRLVTLRDEGVALSIEDGTASIRLARFDRNKEYFEMDAPGVTIAAETNGLYRLDVNVDGDVQTNVRDGGRARIYSETSGFTLRDNRSAKLINRGNEAGDWELSSAAGFDEWDRWNDDRERYLVTRLKFDGRERYYDRDVWGAEELDAYGNWSYRNDYGWVWRPHVTVINNYVNWAPYRYGHWRWCPPYGWTWVGDEPWGWAPYHHGRWVYVDNDWCWAPRGYGYQYKRSWWRPALVAFVYVPTQRGEYITWYPLGYGQRDPRSRYWQQNSGRNNSLSPLRRDEINNLQRINPIYQRAVNALPAREFGSENARARPATIDLARRAVSSEPVLGRLPVTPTRTGISNSLESNEGVRSARQSGNVPARISILRSTGAASRTPGVSLDDELQRSRVYQGREPVRRKPEDGMPVRQAERNSGAVERMRGGVVAPRPVFERRVPESDINRTTDNHAARPAPIRRTDENNSSRPSILRSKDERGASAPTRNVQEPVRPNGGDENRSSGSVNEGRERPRPVRREIEDGIGDRNSVERRERTERREAPVERPRERAPAPVQEERPNTRDRNYERREDRSTVRPTAREERPQERENSTPPRSSPPASSAPAPSRGDSNEPRRERPARPSMREH